MNCFVLTSGFMTGFIAQFCFSLACFSKHLWSLEVDAVQTEQVRNGAELRCGEEQSGDACRINLGLGLLVY